MAIFLLCRMAKLRSINTHFWDDNYIVELDPIEKLMFLYLITNPLTTIAGAYELPLRRIAFDTGIDREMVVKILDRSNRAAAVLYGAVRNPQRFRHVMKVRISMHRKKFFNR